MTTNPHTDTSTRDAIARILKGEPPNGLTPATGDVLAELYAEVVNAHAKGGTESAQKAAAAYIKANPAVQVAMSGDLPMPWTEKTSPKTADYVRVLEALGYDFRINVCNDVVEVNGVPIMDVQASKLLARTRGRGRLDRARLGSALSPNPRLPAEPELGWRRPHRGTGKLSPG